MAEKKGGKKHIVVFQDEEGNVIKTSFVPHGKKAEAPSVPEKKGETEHHEIRFQGWDHDITMVSENLIVKAVYGKVPKKYLIMYLDEKGKMIDTEMVSYGQSAVKGISPEKKSTKEYEFLFKGWDKSLDHIEKDTMTRPLYEKRKRSYLVRFLQDDGSLLKEESVHYGEAASAPSQIEKPADFVWHYIFKEWDKSFSCITEDTDVQAVFTPHYNEYTVRIFEDEKLIDEKKYHYKDKIVYPSLKKKGYNLCWDKHPENVYREEEIHASWQFANPLGKVIETERGIYQIINPSVKNGAVCLLQNKINEEKLCLDRGVFLGDYFYRLEEIGECAFRSSDRVKILELPDSVRVIQKKGLADCACLEKVIFGKNLRMLGETAFAGDLNLKEVVFTGQEKCQLHKRSFGQLRSRVKIIPVMPHYEWLNRNICAFSRIDIVPFYK
ncbi:MAG: leucine-rich repeat domain-containing protein [Eubacterium sp.]|nr:leucine-rich repeat domain-containing protein [Eubacterium sp.]MDY5497282.1 leucine-rich repeat protein [Anaerobutyricum sp.]